MKENVRTFLQATVILLTLGITAQAQPTVVTEIPRGSSNFVTAGNFVFFTSGDSLLRTDGTASGTIALRSGLSTTLESSAEFNNMLFFISGDQLWRSDGTPGGTIQLISRDDLEILSGVNSTLFFQGSDAATGQELYQTNGTAAGTTLVRDINPGPADGFLGNSAIVNNDLFFRGNNGVHGDELWRSNGTAGGTMMIEDMNPGSANGFVHGSPYDHGSVYSFNGLFYFTADTPANGEEPWVSNGTAAGTFILTNTEPGAAEPLWILWGIGHAGAVYVIIQPEHTGSDSPENTAVLWKTSGTTATTVALGPLHTDFFAEIEYRNPFRIYKDKVYFFAHQRVGDGPHFLWVTDGTPSGTFEVTSIGNERTLPTFSFFDVVGDYMIFNGSADGNPSPIYRSDGTAAGTGPWYRLNSATQFKPPAELTEVGNLFFYADHDGFTDIDGGNPLDPDDYFHLFQNDGQTWNSMRTMFGVSTIGTDNIVDYNGIVAFTTQNDQEGSTDTQKYLWTYDPATSGNALIGNIDQEVWNNVPGTRVSSIPVDEPPSTVRELTLFEIPSNTGDNYGSRVRGYILAPSSGSYTFWIASDDQGELWLSTDMDPANKRKIAEVIGWTNPRQWNKYPSQQSAQITLFAGEKYYIEALLKEGTGRDHLAVGWQAPGGILERPILGNRLMPYEGNSLPVIAITNPQEGDTFTSGEQIIITADASDADGDIVEVKFYNGLLFLGEDETAPYSFTWEARLGNINLIAKATDNDGGTRTDTVNFTVTRSVACEGSGMIRQEFWTNVTGTRVSNIPTNSEPDFTQDLTMFEGPASSVGDNYGSRIRGYICPPASGQYTFWIAGDDQVELWLSTDMDPENKVRIAYHTGWTNSRQWTKYPSQQSAPITLAANQRYYIEALMKEGSGADHVSVGWQLPDGALQRPIAGSHLIPFGDSEPPTACAGTGSIMVETWTGIDGSRVSSIPISSPPDITGERTLFEAPTNVGSNFGSRFRGYLCVPTTGNYTFWIASDDHSELWLSTDDDPVNKRLIANVFGWTSPRQWTKYTTQKSAPINLVAGQQYYIEALYKEDEGGDNMAVGWQLPDGTMERPIPGNRLSPFDDTNTMSLAETSTDENAAMYSQISVYPNPARSGDPELTIAGYEGIEETIETQVEIINMTGEVVFEERISCGGNCGSYLMNINKQLVPGVYMVNMKTNGVRSSKRLLVK